MKILMINGEPYALLSDVAKEFGVGLSTLYRATKSGKIRCIELQHRRLLNLEDAKKWYSAWELIWRWKKPEENTETTENTDTENTEK